MRWSHPTCNQRIGFTPEEEKRLVDLDYAYMAREQFGDEGMVGQGLQGLMADGLRLRGGGAGRPASLFVVLALLVPLGLLFRYSLNAFVPGRSWSRR